MSDDEGKDGCGGLTFEKAKEREIMMVALMSKMDGGWHGSWPVGGHGVKTCP